MKGTSWLAAGLLALANLAVAAPVADLKGGQTGRIEFSSTTPEHRWAVIRGRLGPTTTVTGDLLMPSAPTSKVPAVVFSHGSEGVSSLYYDVWATALNRAGFAVFVVDSFTPRGEEKVTGPVKQLTWNIATNLADSLYALKLLATHPQIDSTRIYHMGWSRGGQVVLDAAWPTYQQHIVPTGLKWAGSIAIYPGCNMRYRVDHHSRLPSPMLLLLGEKDDMTPAKPCVEYAEEMAAEGHAVTYRVYPGATHVFDRLNQERRQYKEGNFNLCSLDFKMPYGAGDPSFGTGRDKLSGATISSPREFGEYISKCQQATLVTVESNQRAREQAVNATIEFLVRSK